MATPSHKGTLWVTSLGSYFGHSFAPRMSVEQEKGVRMKKTLYWIILVLGFFLTLGTIITVLSHTAQIANRITLGSIPFVLIGIILDFVTNPAGLLGVILLVWARLMKKKVAKQ